MLKNFKIKTFFIFLILLSLLYGEASFARTSTEKESPDWFWFFYEYSSDEKAETVVYRPFLLESEGSGKLFQASLMPLFFWRYKDETKDVVKGFFGLYGSDSYSHTKKGDDYDSGLFPLYLYGSGTSHEDNYLFVYPIGGNIRGKFGYDRISPWVFPFFTLFFLFPPSSIFSWQSLFLGLAALIPVYTEFEFKDYEAKAIFWPFIAWGKGDKRGDFRVLPFYAHNYKDGWYDNYSWLLLINYRELYLKNDTHYTFFFFPFYGKKWSDSGDFQATTILWPFFSWGYNKKTNDRSYNLPWPFVQIRDCDRPKVYSRIFFPFYGKYHYENSKTFFVTHLYFTLQKETESYTSDYKFICIIMWYFKRDYLKTHEYYGNSWGYFKLWPLLQIEWNDRGMYGINILSLLPFRDTMGYEKLYQPFWTIFEYRVKENGEKHLGILLRTYYQVWSQEFFKMKIPLIVSYSSKRGTVTKATFLLNSFGYEKNSQGKFLKFFWLPLRIGEGDKDLKISNNIDEDISNYETQSEHYVKLCGFNYNHSDLNNDSYSQNFYIERNCF
jgi:hypothetical protein